MGEWLVITLDHNVHFIGSHNRCYIWLISNIRSEELDNYYIVPLSLCEKFGINIICEKLVEFFI